MVSDTRSDRGGDTKGDDILRGEHLTGRMKAHEPIFFADPEDRYGNDGRPHQGTIKGRMIRIWRSMSCDKASP